MGWLRLAMLIVAGSGYCFAQFWMIDQGLNDAGKAVTADVTATLTAQTPWGPFSTVDNGRYWRSGKDRLRFDYGNGLSIRLDERGPIRYAFLDDVLRIADISVRRNQEPPGRSRVQDPFGAEVFAGLFPRGIKIKISTSSGVLEGQKVSIRRAEHDGVSYELWTSESLQIVLLSKYRTASTEFEQKFHNLRIEEPDPSLFALPSGYKMHVTCLGEANEEGLSHPPIHDSVGACR